MGLTLITAVLSGLLLGALAAAVRRFVLLIVTLPILLVPVAYVIYYRDAIVWNCLYASRFNTEACLTTSSFVEQTVLGLHLAALFGVVHVTTGVSLALFLMMTRWTINHIFKRKKKPTPAEPFSLPDDPMAQITVDELIFSEEGERRLQPA